IRIVGDLVKQVGADQDVVLAGLGRRHLDLLRQCVGVARVEGVGGTDTVQGDGADVPVDARHQVDGVDPVPGGGAAVVRDRPGDLDGVPRLGRAGRYHD